MNTGDDDWNFSSNLLSFIFVGLPLLFSCSLVCPPSLLLLFFFLLLAHCVVDFTAPFQQTSDITPSPAPLAWVFLLIVLRPVSERAAAHSLWLARWGDAFLLQQVALGGLVCEMVWFRRRRNRSPIIEGDRVDRLINQRGHRLNTGGWLVWTDTARQRIKRRRKRLVL